MEANIQRIPLLITPEARPPLPRAPLCCFVPAGLIEQLVTDGPLGVLSNQRSAPRPMGESSLLLAEASVGKNAERVSHELGSTRAAYKYQRRRRRVSVWHQSQCARRTARSPDSDDSSVITSGAAGQPLHVLQ